MSASSKPTTADAFFGTAKGTKEVVIPKADIPTALPRNVLSIITTLKKLLTEVMTDVEKDAVKLKYEDDVLLLMELTDLDVALTAKVLEDIRASKLQEVEIQIASGKMPTSRLTSLCKGLKVGTDYVELKCIYRTASLQGAIDRIDRRWLDTTRSSLTISSSFIHIPTTE